MVWKWGWLCREADSKMWMLVLNGFSECIGGSMPLYTALVGLH